MATHFSILAWRIPWTEEPRRLQSMGSQRVGHYLAINHLNRRQTGSNAVLSGEPGLSGSQWEVCSFQWSVQLR